MMIEHNLRFGLSCALLTPFAADGRIAVPLLVEHAAARLAEGCDSITLFGTTGEGASLGLAERAEVLAAAVAAGIDARRSLIGCIASASLPEAVAQAQQLLAANVRALLVAPPFYFKNLSGDGLFAWFAALFGALGPAARDVIVYHIPSVTAVPIPIELVGRLRQAFPAIVRAVKDSGGDWAYSERLLATNGDLDIMIGDERHLAEGLRHGAQGTISGLANVLAPRLRAMLVNRADDQAIFGLVEQVLRHPVTPAVKALLAARTGNAEWRRARPPLEALGGQAVVEMDRAWRAISSGAAG
jgi:4-hydroxy-tetrahydrodipicolinate synthase